MSKNNLEKNHVPKNDRNLDEKVKNFDKFLQETRDKMDE